MQKTLIILSLVLIIGCEGEAAEQPQQDISSSSASMTLDTLFEGKSVYIAGFYSDTIHTTTIACYWKDGARIDLDDGWAEDIKVVDGDV